MITNNGTLPPIDPFAKIFLQPPTITPSTTTKPPQIQSPSKLPPGAKIVGNYLLGKTVGQGTFGKVHLGMHLPTSEKVAVKLIDKKNMRPKDITRVKNEISILSAVRHRNILQLYQIIETQKSVLLITQFLQKGQLFRQIIKQKKFSEDQACLYFQQIVAGVQYLHRNKIAHRDLKPENILIDYDNQIKIIDFGLSTSFVKGKDLKSFCGSPCYAAPEIVESKAGYNPIQSDLWSLGVILFVMLAGYLPFCDQDINTVYKQIIQCNYKIPSHVSAAAKDLIQGLLVKTPNKRISLQQIKDHQWFNRVTPLAAYGLNKGEKLKIDSDLIDRMKQLSINQDKVREGLIKNQKSKETASYFIFMKKLSRNNQKIQSYIGGNHFNPKFIEIDVNSQEIQTQTFSDPFTVIEATQGPEMQGQVQQPLASNSSPDDNNQWNVSSTLQEEKQIDKEVINGLIKNVFQLLISFKPKKNHFQQILSENYNQQSRIKKVIFQKKEADFYINRLHKKSRFQLRNPSQKQTSRFKRVQSNNYEIKRKFSQSSDCQQEKSTINSQKKGVLVFKNVLQKKRFSLLQNMRLSIDLKKKASKLLPYLSPQELGKIILKKERGRSKMKEIFSKQHIK